MIEYRKHEVMDELKRPPVLQEMQHWWVEWFISAGIDEQSSLNYSRFFLEQKIDPSNLTEFDSSILKEIGVSAIGDRLRIIRRAKGYLEEYRKTKKKNELQFHFAEREVKFSRNKKQKREASFVPSNAEFHGSLLYLPKEIIIQILRYLSLANWSSIMTICKYFRNLISSDEWWTSLHFLDIGPRTRLQGDVFLSKFAPRMTKLTSLHIRGSLASTTSSTAELIGCCKQLRTLSVREDEITDEIVAAIGGNCPFLINLSLEYMHTDNLDPILRNCNNIKKLSLVQLGFQDECVVERIVSRYSTQLEELSLDEFGGHLNLQCIGKKCPQLKSLSVNYVDSAISGLEHLIRGCPKINRLSLIGADIANFSYPQVPGTFDLSMLPVFLPNVNELWINKLLNQQGDFVKMITERTWPSLRLLSLGGFEYVHYPEIEHLIACNKQIEELVLYDCYNIKREDLSELRQMFPHVTFHHGFVMT